jgi:hypothetical protein
VIEQVLADWTDGPPGSPAGVFAANAAWLAAAAMAHNLLRAAGALASPLLARTRVATSAATWSRSPPAPPGTAAATSPCTC